MNGDMLIEHSTVSADIYCIDRGVSRTSNLWEMGHGASRMDQRLLTEPSFCQLTWTVDMPLTYKPPLS